MDKEIIINKNINIPGLVLEGGAMRGMYTAGVLDTLMELGIESDYVVGVSAGALFGVNYLSDQKGRAIRYNKKYNSVKGYMGLIPLIKERSIFNIDFAYNQVPRVLDPFDDETFKKSRTEFYAVITNMRTGDAEYVKIDSVFDQMDTLRASGSMPLVSRPVKLGADLYLDGAVADSIPYEWMAGKLGDKAKIVVVLTRDIDYVKKPLNRIFVDYYKKKYPEFAKKVSNRHNMYNQQIECLKEWEKDGRAFVIRPSEPIKIDRIEKDPDKLQMVYDLGVKDMMSRLSELVEYLGKAETD